MSEMSGAGDGVHAAGAGVHGADASPGSSFSGCVGKISTRGVLILGASSLVKF